MTYLLIHTDGSLERIVSERPLELAALQRLVGGDIEHVRMAMPDLYAIINERGRIEGLPDNARYPNLYGPIVFGRIVAADFVGLSMNQLAVLCGGGSFGSIVGTTIYMSRTKTLGPDDLKVRVVNPADNPFQPKGQG